MPLIRVIYIVNKLVSSGETAIFRKFHPASEKICSIWARGLYGWNFLHILVSPSHTSLFPLKVDIWYSIAMQFASYYIQHTFRIYLRYSSIKFLMWHFLDKSWNFCDRDHQLNVHTHLMNHLSGYQTNISFFGHFSVKILIISESLPINTLLNATKEPLLLLLSRSKFGGPSN